MADNPDQPNWEALDDVLKGITGNVKAICLRIDSDVGLLHVHWSDGKWVKAIG